MVVSNLGIAQTHNIPERTVLVPESKQALEILIVCVMCRCVVRYVYRLQLVLKHLSRELRMGDYTVGVLPCLFKVIFFPSKAGDLDTFRD